MNYEDLVRTLRYHHLVMSENVYLSVVFGAAAPNILLLYPEIVLFLELCDRRKQWRRIKSRPVVELGVMNCRSVDNKLDYMLDHCNDNKLDIVALTETWISNDPSKSNRVVIECAERGYTLHQIPRSSGRRGGGVGVMLNNSIKLIIIIIINFFIRTY